MTVQPQCMQRGRSRLSIDAGRITGRARTMRTTTVLIADSHELIRESMAVLLDRHPSLEVVGAVAEGRSAVSLAKSLKPNVVILDADLDYIDGLQASRQIRVDTPGTGVVMLSTHGRPDQMREFVRDDSSGKAFLVKSALQSVADIVRTVEDVAAGRTVLDPSMVSKLTDGSSARVNGSLRTLSPREVQVLALMAEAYSNRAIAQALFIQPRTVEHHISSILSKLGFNASGDRHGRVHAVLTYLSAAGFLPRRQENTDEVFERFAA